MDALYLLVKNIIVIIVVSAVLELIVPAGSFKPIVRFAIGLFVLLSILQPILTLILHKDPVGLNDWNLEIFEEREEQLLLKKSEAFREKLYAEGQKEAALKMAKQIEALIGLTPGVLKSDTTLTLSEITGELLQVEVIVTAEESETEPDDPEELRRQGKRAEESEREKKITKRIKELIHSFYGIPAEKIIIEWQEGGKG